MKEFRPFKNIKGALLMTFMDALLPQFHVVKGAKKVSFWVPTEDFSAETGMTYLHAGGIETSIEDEESACAGLFGCGV